MSIFRVAFSSLLVGAALYLLTIHRAEVPGIMAELIKNPEFWIGVGFFAVLLIFLWKRVPGMLGETLDARAKAIAGELSQAKRLREEAAALLASYIQKTSQVESEAAAIIAEAKEEAERYARETRIQLRAQIERRAKMAEEKIAQAEAAALAEIRGLAADAAAKAAEKLIAARIDEPRAASLVAESIRDLPDRLN
jgi:F-type H+-transporting ATPase subunit b